MIEYSTDGGQNWTTYASPVGFTTRGAYTVQYRATDRAATPNTSAIQTATFSVVSGDACLPARSDEFDSTLDTNRWSFRHSTTPASGAGAPSVTDGSLRAAAGGQLARPRPAQVRSGCWRSRCPTGDFTVVAKISAPGLDADVGGSRQPLRPGRPEALPDQRQLDQGRAYAQRGRRPTGSAQTYFEMTYEANGTRTLGTRMGLAGPPRTCRRGGCGIVRSGSTITSAYSLTDPEGAGGANWVALAARRTSTP